MCLKDILNEPVHDKTNNLGSDQVRHKSGCTITKKVRSLKFRFKKKRNYTIHVAKTKALISFAVTEKLIWAFVFAYADCWFSHAAAQMSSDQCLLSKLWLGLQKLQ